MRPKSNSRPRAERKVHLHHNGGAACGAVSTAKTWPHTVGRVVWPSVVTDFKCRACERIFSRDNLGRIQADDRREQAQA